MMYFTKPAQAFERPQLEQFAEHQGYDYYAYDMAMEQWQAQFPDLTERWCGEQQQPVQQEQQTLEQILMQALLA